jgi:hypothetical protein
MAALKLLFMYANLRIQSTNIEGAIVPVVAMLRAQACGLACKL